MNILVLVKPVPDPEHEKDITFDEASGRLRREDVPQVIDPQSKNALEAALKLAKESGGEPGDVVALAMAPEPSKDKLAEALAMGADEAYLLSDKAFGCADSLATSRVLAAAVRRIEDAKAYTFDLILAGMASSDGGTAHVPVQLAEMLGRDHISSVCRIEAEEDVIRAVKKTEEVLLTMEGRGPAVLAVTRDINKPRLVTAMGIIKARKKPVTIWNAEDIGLAEELTGIEGSPTRTGRMIELSQSRKSEDLGGSPEEAAHQILQIIRKAGI